MQLFQFSYKALWSRKILPEIFHISADETEMQQLLLLVLQIFTSEIRFNAQIT